MSNKRILWVDWVKFLAIFGVIGIHICSQFLSPNILFSSTWYQAVILESTFRFAIVLFIMASGFLLLTKEQPINVIPRRIKRVILPFIFWLIIYAIIKAVFKGQLGPTWTLVDLISFIIGGFIDPMGISVQFWYVYMMIGLYLLSPLLSRWVQHAPIAEIEYVLIIWAVISLVNFLGAKILLVDYLRYFTGAVGYFILGYYLTIKDSPLLENKRFGIILFLIGSLITIMGTIGLSIITHTQSLFFIRLGDITPGACLQAVGLFILLRNIDFYSIKPAINNIVVKISKDSYGIYLVNILVINIFRKFHLMDGGRLTALIIIINIVLVLVVSDVIVIIMTKIKFLSMFSGR